MTEPTGHALSEGQPHPRSPVDRLARTAAILAGCAALLAGLYFVFLYLLSGD